MTYQAKAAFFAFLTMGFKLGTALMGIEFWNVAHVHGSIWAVCHKQPANQSAAPKCHTPSPCGLSVLRRPTRVGCAGKPTHNKHPAAVAFATAGWRSNPSYAAQTSKPSRPWCAAIALSHSFQCKMQPEQSFERARW
jgi:hypothetical protein